MSKTNVCSNWLKYIFFLLFIDLVAKSPITVHCKLLLLFPLVLVLFIFVLVLLNTIMQLFTLSLSLSPIDLIKQ